jgi:catechol 2,3-dioxygenase-like lactoylglutathione lyase family enzyme
MMTPVTMPKGMILEHVNMNVKNRDESVEFYTKVLGFKILRKYETDTQRVAYLYLDEQLMELNEVFDKEQPLGLRHLGIRVNDMDEAMAHFRAQGVEYVSGPVEFQPKIYATADVSSEKLLRALKPRGDKTFWRISMFRDPNGVILELLER